MESQFPVYRGKVICRARIVANLQVEDAGESSFDFVGERARVIAVAALVGKGLGVVEVVHVVGVAGVGDD